MLGGALLTAIVCAAVAAPVLTRYDPIALSPASRMLPPDAHHLLGTDEFGRDMADADLVRGPHLAADGTGGGQPGDGARHARWGWRRDSTAA